MAFARAVWWLATPALFLGWLLLPREWIPFDWFFVDTDELPLLVGELVQGFRATAAALLLLIVVAVVSHRRGTRRIRVPSLLLPVYVAGYEALVHYSWFNQRHHYYAGPPAGFDLHEHYHTETAASLLAVGASILVAIVVYRLCRNGVEATPPRWAWLPAAAVLLSVTAIWIGTDQLLFAAATF